MDAATVDPEEFEALVAHALDGMPAWVQEAVSGVVITIEEAPPADWRGTGLLLGQFHGIPRTRTGGRVPGTLPDQIQLYREPILAVSRDRGDLVDRVRKVLGHEIGHALGVDEAQLRALGWH